MAKLELALLVGGESKAFLASLTQQIDRLEALSKTKTTSTAKTVYKDTDADEDDEAEETMTKTTKKAATKKAAAFDDDEDEAESEDEAEADADEDEAEEKKPAKKAKAKNLTVEDVNNACRARCERGGNNFKLTKALLKKKFKVDSVHDLDPDQFADVIEVMNDEDLDV